MIHEGGWSVEGDPNGELTFLDPDGNLHGATRPRNLPPPLPTRLGNEITQIRARAEALRVRIAQRTVHHGGEDAGIRGRELWIAERC
jgi:hypothetical protein